MNIRYVIVFGIAILLALLLLAWPKLPDNNGRTSSQVISDGGSTGLGKASRAWLAKLSEQSGVYLLRSGLDAFVARAALADLAERSIDVQYYMFHQDTVGQLLILKLLAAADRGVRVRMLIDDMYGGEGDEVWSALDSHSSIEVRLFNPFVRGRSKNLQFFTRLKTVNHRMHNKTYTVDNQVSIVGGRNIGDEYFDADPDLAFADRDVMTIGAVVPDVSSEFDQYWNSSHAFPISTLLMRVEASSLDMLRSELAEHHKQKQTSVYIDALENSKFAKSIRRKKVQFNSAKGKVIHDSSEKLTKNENWEKELLISQLAPYVNEATEEFTLVSPYFVPGQRGADALCELSKKGVRVSVLTNSLVSNDVAAVHTGYMRHRKPLLRCGVQLYELNEQIKKKQRKRFFWLPGLSKSSLHAKIMSYDKKVMFVGSFNFDQRSLNINNEIGVLFYEPQIASSTSRQFDKHIENVAFKVELVTDNNGKESLRWTGFEDGKEVVFDSEPYASFWQKLGTQLMRVLPIDSML